MSTKTSLKYDHDHTSGQSFHLYADCLEEGHVYLELQGFPFEASSSAMLSDKTPSRLLVRLPDAWAQKLGLLEKNDDAG